ncbi:MAG: SDR family NAD(P)-dependent oxidoreductase, partial [Eubacteriales bacterium]|nr:SDR family NAD(P)-dependent oxidoreductase [Eubacteriales bacterium]
MVVMLTGASGGIGGACARLLARRGCDLVLQYRNGRDNAEALARELSEIGVKALPICADVGDEESVKN